MKKLSLTALMFLFSFSSLKSANALDVQTFRPLNMSQGGFGLYDAQQFEAGRLSLSLHYNFDKHPLEFGLQNNVKVDDIVNDLHTLNLIGTYEFNKFVALNLDLPYQYLSDFEGISNPVRSDEQSVGDLLVSLPIYLGKISRNISAKIIPKVILNTGKDDPFVGEEDVLLGLGVALDRKTRKSSWTLNAEYQSREEETLYNLTIGNRVKLGFGYSRDIGERNGFIWINEITQELPLGVDQNEVNSPAEIFTGFRHISNDEGFIWNVGYSKGLNHGYGAPDYRLFAGVNYVFSSLNKKDVSPIIAPVPVVAQIKEKTEIIKAKQQVKPEQVTIELEKIHFLTNSDKIRPDSYPVLNRLVSLLKKYQEIKTLRIEGHTDSSGSLNYNMSLSRNRALSVKVFLINNGIDISRLTSIGIGPRRPIDTNQTDTGRYNNRRVEFKVLRIEGNREIIFKTKKR